MAARSLYYPYIHFRDEAWLKLSALYWDDVSRIVPRAYPTHDSAEVRALEEAGVVVRVEPRSYSDRVSRLFSLLLDRHEPALVARYALHGDLPRSPHALRLHARSGGTVRLAFIHARKIESSLIQRLLELKLALRGRNPAWLGMHPNIVSAYMIALASEIARRRGLSPISDNAMHLSGVMSCTLADLAQSLIKPIDLQRRRRESGASAAAPERIAMLTLRAVLPSGVEQIPAKRIIQLRREHGAARQGFHEYVNAIRESLASGAVRDASALDEHIRLEYERRLKPELAELQRALRSLGVSTFIGTFGVALTLPAGVLLGPLTTAAIGVSAASLGVAALAQKNRDAAASLLQKSPASFLFVTEQLRPRTLGQRMADSLRRFSLGV